MMKRQLVFLFTIDSMSSKEVVNISGVVRVTNTLQLRLLKITVLLCGYNRYRLKTNFRKLQKTNFRKDLTKHILAFKLITRCLSTSWIDGRQKTPSCVYMVQNDENKNIYHGKALVVRLSYIPDSNCYLARRCLNKT